MNENKITPIPKTYKVIPIEKEFSDGDEPYINRWKETRWIIVDNETGEVIDDAQGYGFKTAQKAYKCVGYKLNKLRIDNNKKKAKEFVKNHKELFKTIDNMVFDAFKDGDKLSSKEIITFIKTQHLSDEPDDLEKLK